MSGAATERLVKLTLSENGTTYLSGDGADDYQVIDQFEQAGIDVRKLGFQPQPVSSAPRAGVRAGSEHH